MPLRPVRLRRRRLCARSHSWHCRCNRACSHYLLSDSAVCCICGRVHAVRTANRIILQRIENDFLWALNGQLGAMLSVLALASNGLSVHELASISDVDVLYVLAIVQIAPHILTGAPPLPLRLDCACMTVQWCSSGERC